MGWFYGLVEASAVTQGGFTAGTLEVEVKITITTPPLVTYTVLKTNACRRADILLPFYFILFKKKKKKGFRGGGGT